MKGISSPAGGKFFNRGDPVDADFTQVDLDVAGTWTEIDLSGIIPAGTAAVLLSVVVEDEDFQYHLRLRPTGDTNEKNISDLLTMGNTVTFWRDRIVPTNGLQSIEYHQTPDVIAFIELTVKGWWK